MCSTDGYPYHLNIYTIKDGNNSVPVGGSILIKIVGVIKEHSDPINHEICFDKFFKTYDLIVNLVDGNLEVIGTVWDNCIQGENKKLKDVKTMKKSTRVEFSYCNDWYVHFCRWNGNSIFNIGSNYCTHFPGHQVKCRAKNILKKHNQGMKGVGVMDHLLSP